MSHIYSVRAVVAVRQRTNDDDDDGFALEELDAFTLELALTLELDAFALDDEEGLLLIEALMLLLEWDEGGKSEIEELCGSRC